MRKRDCGRAAVRLSTGKTELLEFRADPG